MRIPKRYAAAAAALGLVGVGIVPALADRDGDTGDVTPIELHDARQVEADAPVHADVADGWITSAGDSPDDSPDDSPVESPDDSPDDSP